MENESYQHFHQRVEVSERFDYYHTWHTLYNIQVHHYSLWLSFDAW